MNVEVNREDTRNDDFPFLVEDKSGDIILVTGKYHNVTDDCYCYEGIIIASNHHIIGYSYGDEADEELNINDVRPFHGSVTLKS